MNRKKLFIDMTERVLATWAEAFLGLMIVSGIATTVGGKIEFITVLSLLAKAGIATVPAALSLLKGFVATFVGDPNSASLSTRVGNPVP